MSHHIYHTTAYVLEVRNVGERNKSVWLFTRDLGLVIASVQGVRDMKSKLRYSLNEFSCIKASLVRGKEVWRLINTEPIDNYYFALRERPETLKVVARLFSLLKRLLAGEEAHPDLFLLVENALAYSKNTNIDTQENQLEILTVLRILHSLGYVEGDKGLGALLDSSEIDSLHMDEVLVQKKHVLETINKALRESQL